MNLNQALEKLFSLHQFGIKLGLDNIKQLLKFLGNPETNLNAFHVAGSNGKGSTASFIASILIEAGNKTGLYTSPHFVKFNERIRINSEMIPDSYILEFMKDLNQYIDKFSPTFFELTTAMAFKYFAEAGVDYAVIETGLGGRLDATNTIDPIASIITTISKEHTNILSDSIKKIAFEKGGIIKSGKKCFVGLLPDEAIKVMEEKSASVGADLFKLEDYMEKNRDFVKLIQGEFHYNIYNTPLSGIHQLQNSALAVLSVKNTLGIQDIFLLNRAICKVIENSGIQGRFEIYRKHPEVIFDAAHNEEGINSFIREFDKIRPKFDKTILIFGAMKDKDIASMLKNVSGSFDEIYLTSINYERASTPGEIKKIADHLGIKTEELHKPSEFIEKFVNNKNNNCLVVLGSIYLLGKIKEGLPN